MVELFKPLLFSIPLLLFACKSTSDGIAVKNNSSQPWYERASDEELLDSVQRQTFRYFWDYAEPNSGLARERFHPDGHYPMNDDHIVTTGGTGFGVMTILLGIERGFITRSQGMQRLTRIVEFLENADRFHGIWPHWIDGKTGKVKPFSKKDNGGDAVESAFLIQGLLCVRQYCNKNNTEEKLLAQRIDHLWHEMDWQWYTRGENVLYWHWSPQFEWDMNFAVRGYNECLIMYVLAASSPSHPIEAAVYHEGWAKDGEIVAQDSFMGYARILDHYDQDDSPVGPLFWAHYSYLGLNPKGLRDRYGDYWKLNVNHAAIHYAHCVQNPNGYPDYGPRIWGLTSSYSTLRNGKPGIGYAGHRPDRDKGIISPTAALSSMPYLPTESIAALRGFYSYGDKLLGPAGFYDAFSPHLDFWPQRYLAIDQGPIPVMIENHRTGLLWNLFMSCPEVKEGLARLDFKWPDNSD